MTTKPEIVLANENTNSVPNSPGPTEVKSRRHQSLYKVLRANDTIVREELRDPANQLMSGTATEKARLLIVLVITAVCHITTAELR